MPKLRCIRTPLRHEYFDSARSEAPPPFTKGDVVEVEGPTADRWLSRGVLSADLESKKATRKKATRKTGA